MDFQNISVIWHLSDYVVHPIKTYCICQTGHTKLFLLLCKASYWCLLKVKSIVSNSQCDEKCYKASLTGTDGSGVGGHGGGGGQGGRGRGDGHGRSYRVPQTEPPWIFIYLLCVTGRVLEKIFVKKRKVFKQDSNIPIRISNPNK